MFEVMKMDAAKCCVAFFVGQFPGCFRIEECRTEAVSTSPESPNPTVISHYHRIVNDH
jgi:hypothetical protein